MLVKLKITGTVAAAFAVERIISKTRPTPTVTALIPLAITSVELDDSTLKF
ncbi:MAG: hypothetical protein HOP07_18275 [Bacteriovoracaceae bacterium]|nr:hypothetical protein [Bacteriovoracaceae bacterium]